MPIFPLVIVFIIWLSYELKKGTRIREQKVEDFWENERQANLTRKKNIEHLDYITISLESLPFFENIDPELEQYQSRIRILSEKRILNLSGFTNTQLKKEYGAANFPLLSQYDENFTQLAGVLAKWGARLMELGYEKEAVTVLELGIRYKTDISANYFLLAEYYAAHGDSQKLQWLRDTANELQTLMKEPILARLKEFSHEC